MVMVTAVLASVGTAGIPGSGLVMMTIVLNAVNLRWRPSVFWLASTGF